MEANVFRLLNIISQPLFLLSSLHFLQQRQKSIDDVLINGTWVVGNDVIFNWWENNTRYQMVGIDNEGWQSRSDCHKSGSFKGQKYVWKPKNNALSVSKKKPLCDIVGGRDVIIVGDSMSAQFFMTFLLNIWPWPQGKSLHEYRRIPRSIFKSTQTFNIPCSIPFNVSFVRNIYLSLNRYDTIYTLNRTELNLPSKKFIAFSWIQTLEQNHALRRNNIFVLNRGAHYTLDHILVSELTETFTYLQQHHQGSLVIYRDTAKGHPRVKKHRQDTPPLMEELPYSDYDEVEWNTYNYSQFTHQNLLVRNLIMDKFPHIMYMNIAKATDLRRDSHVSTTVLTIVPIQYCLNSDHITPFTRTLFLT